MNADEMEAGRELDALVAEKLMRWHWVSYLEVSILLSPEWHLDYGMQEGLHFPNKREHVDGQWIVNTGVHPKEWDYDRYPPFKYYSTDIAAAWEVVECLRNQSNAYFSLEADFSCKWWKAKFCVPLGKDDPRRDEFYGNWCYESVAEMPILAICRAALKVVQNGR